MLHIRLSAYGTREKVHVGWSGPALRLVRAGKRQSEIQLGFTTHSLYNYAKLHGSA